MSDMRDHTVARSMLDHFGTPTEAARWRNMTDKELSSEYEILQAQLAVGGAELREGMFYALKTVLVERGGIAKLKAGMEECRGQIRTLTEAQTSLTKKGAFYYQQHKKAIREGSNLIRALADASKQIENLKEENVSMAEALKTPLVAPDMKIVYMSDWDKMVGELAHLRQSNQSLSIEKVKSQEVVDSLHAEGVSLREQNQALTHKIEWIMGNGLKSFVKKLRDSAEFTSPYGRVTSCATSSGYADGVRNGYRYHKSNTAMSLVPSFDPKVDQKFVEVLAGLADLSFPYLDALSANYHLSIEEIQAINPQVPEEEEL